MDKIKGHEAAFASKAASSNGTTYGSKGLTIRQHFAAMAMHGLLANHSMVDTLSKQAQAVIVQEAVYYADALIAELNKQTTNESATI